MSLHANSDVLRSPSFPVVPCDVHETGAFGPLDVFGHVAHLLTLIGTWLKLKLCP